MKTNNTKTSIIIPFDGLYSGTVDMLIDDEIEQYIEYLKEENPDYDDYPDYSIDRLSIAKRYAVNYKEWLESEHGIKLNPEFEEIVSPKDYNFSSDRIFCSVHPEELETLHSAFIANDNNQALVDDMFKSRSGFMSFYCDFVTNWKDKPLSAWDCNELSILLPEPDSYYKLWEDDVCNGFFDSVIKFKEGTEND